MSVPTATPAAPATPAAAANAVVLGCGRSGTSIFGELFAALPGFQYWSEPLLADLPDGGPPPGGAWGGEGAAHRTRR